MGRWRMKRRRLPSRPGRARRTDRRGDRGLYRSPRQYRPKVRRRSQARWSKERRGRLERAQTEAGSQQVWGRGPVSPRVSALRRAAVEEVWAAAPRPSSEGEAAQARPEREAAEASAGEAEAAPPEGVGAARRPAAEFLAGEAEVAPPELAAAAARGPAAAIPAGEAEVALEAARAAARGPAADSAADFSGGFGCSAAGAGASAGGASGSMSTTTSIGGSTGFGSR